MRDWVDNSWRFKERGKSKRKSPFVLFEFDGGEITLREVVFSLLIIGVMTLIGFLISGKIEEHVNATTLVYRQAPGIVDNDEFKHAIKTDIGNAFVHGTLNAKDVVTHPHVKGEYLSIVVKKQEYNMHTEIYTTTDSKGRVHTHTRHYWSWDTVSTKEFKSKEVEYCGVTFPYDKFNYLGIGSKETIYKEHGWSDKRELIYTRPKSFDVTIFGNLIGNTIEGNGIELSGKSLDEYRKNKVESHTVNIFWALWIGFIVLFVGAFYAIDNDWLEG